MMLDIITGDFVRNSRTVKDGPRIQLEIPQALEKVQLEAEEKDRVTTCKHIVS
ncbi:hypothetical protein BDW02DRAFT_563882 [Decorospora gaudefroyi]|uniref:Uncharacterized protein n=1 Tax=Decorospora gaudefroyi TaxID=184978 RepID=A0A6A5KT43_9PLEO|nr:hypothetical protein BDW02DRAFT_563882 [Decorospora gaudefroyi]